MSILANPFEYAGYVLRWILLSLLIFAIACYSLLRSLLHWSVQYLLKFPAHRLQLDYR